MNAQQANITLGLESRGFSSYRIYSLSKAAILKTYFSKIQPNKSVESTYKTKVTRLILELFWLDLCTLQSPLKI
jgi:hypothetical protein